MVRRKTSALRPLLGGGRDAQLDYDFHVCVDDDTGQGMVVRRTEDGTVTASGPVGDLAEPEAVERLSLTVIRSCSAGMPPQGGRRSPIAVTTATMA